MEPHFWSLWTVCQYKRAPKKVQNPDPILAPVSRNLAPSPVNFLDPQIRNKTVENKSREIYDFLCSFELAGAADQRAGQSCGIVRLCITPTSKQGLLAQLLQGARTSAYMRTCREHICMFIHTNTCKNTHKHMFKS